jgi:hypothetical protein
LKPVSHLIGSKVETRRFQAIGQLHSTCTAPPESLLLRLLLLLLLLLGVGLALVSTLFCSQNTVQFMTARMVHVTTRL